MRLIQITTPLPYRAPPLLGKNLVLLLCVLGENLILLLCVLGENLILLLCVLTPNSHNPKVMNHFVGVVVETWANCCRGVSSGQNCGILQKKSLF